jgi:hypothetical protein
MRKKEADDSRGWRVSERVLSARDATSLKARQINNPFRTHSVDKSILNHFNAQQTTKSIKTATKTFRPKLKKKKKMHLGGVAFAWAAQSDVRKQEQNHDPLGGVPNLRDDRARNAAFFHLVVKREEEEFPQIEQDDSDLKMRFRSKCIREVCTWF